MAITMAVAAAASIAEKHRQLSVLHPLAFVLEQRSAFSSDTEMRSGSVLRAPVHPPLFSRFLRCIGRWRACRSPRRIFHLLSPGIVVNMPDDISGIVVLILHRGIDPLDQGKESVLYAVIFFPLSLPWLHAELCGSRVFQSSGMYSRSRTAV